MNIKQLQLVQFRNYENISFSFEKNCIHCIYGKNAQGKTNLIEAIYYLSYLHSFRTNSLSSLVKEDKEYFMIEAKVENKQRDELLKIIVSDQKKHLFRFNNPISKYSDFVGIVNAILFCPDDMMIFNQSPKYRRRFIDMELIKLSKTYTSTLSHYQTLLKERNAALKQNMVDSSLIDIYTTQMIEDEVIIIQQRKQFIEKLMNIAREIYPFFSNQKEELDAIYQTFIPCKENLKDELKNAYKKIKERDELYHQTSIGIHRDDIQFLLNGIPINDIASQGQKRSFLLALKLSLCQIVFEKTNQYPILLLDDVFSELDEIRKRQLLEKLPENMQIFITTTQPVDSSWFNNRKVKLYRIEKGSLKEANNDRY